MRYIVENGGFILPGTASSGLVDVPGWYSNNTDWHQYTGTRNEGDDTDGDGWYWSQKFMPDGAPEAIWNMTSTTMVEGETYTFIADIQGRHQCDTVTMSVVASDDPNIALASTVVEYTYHENIYKAGVVSYTATAADAGKQVGVSFLEFSEVNDAWMRLDNVRMIDNYREVYNPQVVSPADEATEVEPDAVMLEWTPSNDPNMISQTLTYYGNL